MIREEVGLIEDKNKKPLDTALTTFVGFNTIGLIPLIPLSSCTLQVLMFWYNMHSLFNNIYCNLVFSIGLIKGKVVDKPILRSGLNTLAIGGIAASLAYIADHLLRVFVK